MKNKHLSFDDRLEIEKGLKENKSFKAIGTIINKDCITISKEIKNHIASYYIIVCKFSCPNIYPSTKL